MMYVTAMSYLIYKSTSDKYTSKPKDDIENVETKLNWSSTTGTTSRAGTAYTSRTPWFTPRFVVLDR